MSNSSTTLLLIGGWFALLATALFVPRSALKPLASAVRTTIWAALIGVTWFATVFLWDFASDYQMMLFFLPYVVGFGLFLAFLRFFVPLLVGTLWRGWQRCGHHAKAEDPRTFNTLRTSEDDYSSAVGIVLATPSILVVLWLAAVCWYSL